MGCSVDRSGTEIPYYTNYQLESRGCAATVCLPRLLRVLFPVQAPCLSINCRIQYSIIFVVKLNNNTNLPYSSESESIVESWIPTILYYKEVITCHPRVHYLKFKSRIYFLESDSLGDARGALLFLVLFSPFYTGSAVGVGQSLGNGVFHGDFFGIVQGEQRIGGGGRAFT